MIFDIDKREDSSLIAIDDSGNEIAKQELVDFSTQFNSHVGKRCLIFILSENSIGPFAGYVSALSNKIVPLILSRNTDRQLLDILLNLYKPEFIWLPEEMNKDFSYNEVFSKYSYSLVKTGYNSPTLHEELSLLLPTSGSTGSPKLVRHSYANVFANAKNVASFFNIQPKDRPIAILPMHYTMGLSVITSHLYAGSTLLLAKKSLTNREFWDFVKKQEATSFTGVPYSFEVLYKLRFFRMKLPHLKLLTQGGGKLREDLFRFFAENCQKNGISFIATYGQTEGTARMAYLPAEMATKKTCSIGKAIPNGELLLVDEDGEAITAQEAVGQMVYKGPNVTMGYANNSEDLVKGDENNGVLYTGDIAKRDEDGYYYIIGRMKRFLKIYGFRVGLDELEEIIKSTHNIDCLCTGNDEKLEVLITNRNYETQVKELLVEKTGLFHMAINVNVVDEIPKNEFGKTVY